MIAAAALAAAAGCARDHWVYEKSRTTAVRMEEDMSICRKEATARSKIAVFPGERIDRDAFNRCMEHRGYTVRRERS